MTSAMGFRRTLILRIERALTFIADNYSDPLSGGQLAKAVHLSNSYVAHLFQRRVGVSPKRFLKALRLRFAQRLLETSTLSVKEVFRHSGLGDESHFVRAFKA